MSDIRRLPFELELRGADTLRGDLWRPRTDAPGERVVVICHGFKGFKDWGFFPHVARRLAARLVCPVVTFNFTGSGVGADLESFTELEAFGRNTFGKESEDLGAVLDGLERGRLGHLEFSPAQRIGVMGHSRGGVAAILSGERPSVRAVVTWAAIAGVERYVAMFEGVPPGETVPVLNARTGDVLPLHRDVADEVRADPSRFDLSAFLRRAGLPVLVVHGTDDESVPADDGRRLAEAAATARLALIEGTGHTFGVGHPFEGPSPALDRAIELTANHFDTHLGA